MTFVETFRDARRVAAIDRDLQAARKQAGSAGWLARDHSLARITGFARAGGVSLHVIILGAALFNPAEFSTIEPTSFRFWLMVFFLIVLMPNAMASDRLTEASDFERLRMPTFGAMFLFRWLRVLPDQLLIGACWVMMIAHVGWRGPIDSAGLVYLAGLGLAPLLFTTQYHAREALIAKLGARHWSYLYSLSHLPAIAITMHLPWIGDAPPLWLGIALLTWTAIGTPLSLRFMLRQGFDPATAVETDVGPVFELDAAHAGLPDRHDGRRTLLASAWFLQWARLRPRLVALRSGPGGFFLAAIALLFMLLVACIGALGVYLADDAPSVFTPLLAVLLAVSFGPAANDTQWFLFGADLRELERTTLAWRLVFELGPMLILATSVLLVLGTTPERLATLALLAGLALWRIGFGGLFGDRGGWHLGLGLAILVGLMTLAGIGVTATTAFGLAAITGMLGVTGMVCILATSESKLLARMREEQADAIAT